MDSEVRTRFRIDVSRARAWKLLRNLELADRYVPGVSDCTITSEQREGVGASRASRQEGSADGAVRTAGLNHRGNRRAHAERIG